MPSSQPHHFISDHNLSQEAVLPDVGHVESVCHTCTDDDLFPGGDTEKGIEYNFNKHSDEDEHSHEDKHSDEEEHIGSNVNIHE